jgi:hypothetical protein
MRSRKPEGQQQLLIKSVSEDTVTSAPARSSPDITPLETFCFRCSRDMARELIRESRKAGGIRQYIGRLMKMSGVRNVPDWDVEETPRYRSLD